MLSLSPKITLHASKYSSITRRWHPFSYLCNHCLLIQNLEKRNIKRHNRNTYLKQVKLFQTWCKELGIKEPTLGTFPPIHKEQIFGSYFLEISQGRNLNNFPRLGVKSVQNYLRAAASHATDNGQRDPHLWYNPSSLPLNGSKPFPMLKKIISHMSKYSDRR